MWPRYIAADDIAMTILAGRVPAVVTRVIAIPIMSEVGRHPTIRAMADIALLGGVQVPVPLTGCRRSVMAGITLVRCAGIVHPATADKGGRGMAEMAVQAGWNMVVVHTCGGIAIVA